MSPARTSLFITAALLVAGIVGWRINPAEPPPAPATTAQTSAPAPAKPGILNPADPGPEARDQLATMGLVNPAGFMKLMRSRHSGADLSSRLFTIASIAAAKGDLQQCRALLLAIDTPDITLSAADLLAKRMDAANLGVFIDILHDWSGIPDFTQFATHFLYRAGEVDTQQALRLVEASDLPRKAELKSFIVGGLVQRDRPAAMQAMRDDPTLLATPNSSGNLVSALAADASPTELWNELKTIPSLNEHSAFTTLVNHASRSHPEEVATLLSTQSAMDPHTLDEAFQSLGCVWATVDTVATSAWLTTLTADSAFRDSAIFGFLNYLHNTKQRPPEAKQWAESINDPAKRESALKLVQ